MLYKYWKVYYKEILDDFNFDIKKDIESARLLDNLFLKRNNFSVGDLKDLFKNKKITIFGAGPSLIESINNFKENQDMITITADGVTTAFVEKDIIPDVVVTDLDGKISDQIAANKKGSIAIIHAHGDNIDKIIKYVPKFKGNIIGTTQTDPSIFDNIHNFGGFTDGDRCVFLSDHFKAKKIYLSSFDYENKIGKYSFSKNKNKIKKLKKLKWCRCLIEELRKENPNIEYI